MTENIQQLAPNNPSPLKYVKEYFLASGGEVPENMSFEHPFIVKEMCFSVCLQGECRMLINFREYAIRRNTFVTILPNQIIQVLERSDDFRAEMLYFSIDYLVDMALPKEIDVTKKIIIMPLLTLSEEEAGILLKYNAFIVSTFADKNHFFAENVTKGLLYLLFMEIASKYAESDTFINHTSTGRSEEIVGQFFVLLMENHKQERNASFYSDKLCITTKYLSGTLKKVTGRSVNSWLEDAIIMTAKVYLKSSDLTVLQISEELNFPNPSYFGRYFKKLTGMTPKEYRGK